MNRDEIYFNRASALIAEFTRQGSLDGWKQSFAKLFLFDPELAAKAVRYAQEKLDNRDLQRAAPLVALRYASEDNEIAYHLSVAIFKQSPNNVKDSIKLSRKWSREGFTLRGTGAILKQTAQTYLLANHTRFLKSQQDVYKYLLTWLHQVPHESQNKLFPTGRWAKKEKRAKERSLYAQIKTLSPKDAGAFIIQHKLMAPKILSALPNHVERGKTEKGNPIFRNPYLLDEDFLFAFVERLTAKQAVIYAKMLEKHGVMDSPKCRAAWEAAKTRAEGDKEAGQRLAKAATKVSSPTFAKSLTAASERALEKKGQTFNFAGKKVLLLTDKSGSQAEAIRQSGPVAAYIVKLGGDVLWVAFDNEARLVGLTKNMTYEQIQKAASRLTGEGGTTIASGFDYARQQNYVPDIVIALTDGQTEGREPEAMKICFPHEPMLVELHFGGHIDMRSNFEKANYPYTYIEGNGLAESQWDNVLGSIRDNRHALVEEILALPFYTLADL